MGVGLTSNSTTRGKKLNAWRFTLLLIAAIVIAATWGTTVYTRSRLLRDPLSLKGEHDIYAAAQLLIGRVESKHASSREDLETLRRLMQKLRDGWDGFVVQHYTPIDFTSVDLWHDVCWELAKQVGSNRCGNREALLALLYDMRPAEGSPDERGYNDSLYQFGIEIPRATRRH